MENMQKMTMKIVQESVCLNIKIVAEIIGF